MGHDLYELDAGLELFRMLMLMILLLTVRELLEPKVKLVSL